MLAQLRETSQWFVDGTFSVAPTGFQQMLIIVVLIIKYNMFYPSCYILLTNSVCIGIVMHI